MKGIVLVTGGAGFIGSHICNELLSRGYRVIAVDMLSDYYSIHLKKLRMSSFDNHKLFNFEKIDISNSSSVDDLFSRYRFDGVIHLAAQAGVRLPFNESGRYIESNILGFYNIIINTIKSKIPSFVYASSSSVYGETSPIPFSESSLILTPKSFYGATKLNNEQTARILAAGSETSTRGLRFFTVYGPWGRPDMAYFRLMAASLGKHSFQLFGDGSVERDFTYIDDVTKNTVDLYENLLSTKSQASDIVNIGGHRPLSMNFLVDLVQEISGTKINVNQVSSNKNDSKKTVADNSYLQSLLGKTRFTPLEEGIENFYSWMKQPEIVGQVETWIKSSI
jgi:UDP-glucuronate 4-epimerase